MMKKGGLAASIWLIVDARLKVSKIGSPGDQWVIVLPVKLCSSEAADGLLSTVLVRSWTPTTDMMV